jgi:predicted dehydrogenase
MAYKAALIGLGKIGMGYDRQLSTDTHVLSHARALHLHPDFKLVGAADPDPVLGKAFADIYGATAYRSVDELLDEIHPDVMVVASVTPTHNGILTLILAHHTPKAILCEKPLAYDSAVAQIMVDACARQRVPLYVNFIRRADPGVREIKSRIDTGCIVMPFKAVVWYSKGLLHNGSHFADLLGYWFGPIRAAALINPGRSLPDHDAEPDFQLTFDQGSAFFCAAQEENYSHYTIEIVAANGRLRYEQGGALTWQAAAPHPELAGYRQLQAVAEKIGNDMNHYQYRVAEQLAQALRGTSHTLCTGAEAIATGRWLTKLIDDRNLHE